MFQVDLLKKKTILVTGGGTGLGKAMALRFAELGANLILTSRRQQVLEETAHEIEKKGANVFIKTADVRNYEALEEVFHESEKVFKKVDVLVNNAAGNFISPTEQLSPNAFQAITGIVLNGTFHATLAAAKRWIQHKCGGSVLNIVATYTNTGAAYIVPSACAKAGVVAMTRSLAVEWAKYNIRLNGIAPGFFPTKQMVENLIPPQFEKDMMKGIPVGRAGNPDELANLAAFLISDYADYINGEVITIDGGGWLTGAGSFTPLREMTPEDWALIKERSVTSKKLYREQTTSETI